jgi:hypothetical protein
MVYVTYQVFTINLWAGPPVNRFRCVSGIDLRLRPDTTLQMIEAYLRPSQSAQPLGRSEPNR